MDGRQSQAEKFKELARKVKARWRKLVKKDCKRQGVGEAGVKAIGAMASLALASSAGAQVTGPAKMILIHSRGIAVTDFPSMVRCEAARRAILQAIALDNANRPPPEVLPGGGTIMTLPTAPPKMICAPA